MVLTVRAQGRKASTADGKLGLQRSLSSVVGRETQVEGHDHHEHQNSDGSTSLYFCATNEAEAIEWAEAFQKGTLAPAMPMGAHADMLQRRKTMTFAMTHVRA